MDLFAGEAHKLVVTDDSPEPVLVFFAVEGGLIYLTKAVDSTIERPVSMCASWAR
jgi:hypothetical protein